MDSSVDPTAVAAELEAFDEDGEQQGDQRQPPSFDDLAARLAEAGVESQLSDSSDVLIANFPNGRDTRRVLLGSRSANLLSTTTRFTRLKFLGDYQAIWDSEEDVVEARLSHLAEIRLWRQAGGIEVRSDYGDWVPMPLRERVIRVDDSRAARTRLRQSDFSWRIRVEKDSKAVELSDATGEAQILLRTGGVSRVTMKLQGFKPQTHDEAVGVLEDVGQAFLFDLDLRDGIPVQLLRQSRQPRRQASTMTAPAPTFPSNIYASEPISLYQYGRQASGLPLLQFLAFYQVLEFYFPVFAREESIRQLRNQLQDPRFNISDDVKMGSLLSNLSPSRLGAEREQLRTVLNRCFDRDELREYVETFDGRTNHFCSNKQAIKGVDKLSLSSSADLRDQIADRIYAIRCRIVHTKQEGGQSAVELLLPSSREVRSLGYDVDLVLHAAQRAIIAAASRR